MKKIAIIVAGGNGQRMGTPVPKQFLLLQGKPLLWHTLNTFLLAYDDLQVILVLPEEYMSKGEELKNFFNEKNRVTVTAGGETRFDSVKNGLQLVTEDAIVFVHDGVRCLVSKELIYRCCRQAAEKGSAIPAVAATDSIRIANGETSIVADRGQVRIIQTPQTFSSEIILPAFQQPYNPFFTDEATVVESYGKAVFLIEGDYHNIKVTRPVDLLIAEKILGDKW